MKRETIEIILLLGGVVAVIIGCASLLENQINNNITQMHCCGGVQCSDDTYYILEDNQCHLVSCEQSRLFNPTLNCTYDGVIK